jgi:hypothetical protein
MPNDPEISARLEKILRGAFAGPPTPLKDIPTRKGKDRKLRPSAKRARHQSHPAKRRRASGPKRTKSGTR